MGSVELAKKLSNRDAGITAEELFCTELSNLVDKGLKVITICYDGSGRSYNVAQELNNLGIPAVRLIGGISQFKDNQHLVECLPYATAMINFSPYISIIQTREEVSKNMFFISRIQRPIISKDSRSAIETIKRMES